MKKLMGLPNKKNFLRCTTWVVCAVFLAGTARADEAYRPAPRLVVLLVVDQFRADYLDRFRDRFSAGFARLVQNGAVFSRAYHDHAGTVTAAGHATIASGLYPSHSGIIQNAWYDRTENKSVKAIEDDRYPPLERASYGVSPERMNGTTLGDWLKTADPHSKVVAVSLKDRSAVLLGGKQADAAYWYNDANGGFTSSTYYMDSLPAWVSAFNQKNFVLQFLKQAWTPLGTDTETWPDDPADALYEGSTQEGWLPAFPHVMPDTVPALYKMFENTPWADEYTLNFAREAVEQLDLGSDDTVDLLAVSLSATDLIGHRYGPDSLEEADQIVRLDQAIGGFLMFLDERIDLNRVLVVMTADHGVCPIPEYAADHGKDVKRFDFSKDVERFDASLQKRLGVTTPLLNYYESMIYIDRGLLYKNTAHPEEMIEEIRRHFARHEMVARVYRADDLIGIREEPDRFEQLVRHSFNFQRSGDLIIVFKENRLDSSSVQGTDHGSPYDYDTHVPIIFMGTWVKPGRVTRKAYTVDIAPAVAELLGIPVPDTVDGQSRRILDRIVR